MSVYWVVAETGLFVSLSRGPQTQDGTPTPLVWFLTVVPSFLAAAGFVPAILEVIMTKSSHGVSLVFIVLDTVGSFFGILSLLFKDFSAQGGDATVQLVLAAGVYIMVFLGDIILWVCWFIYRQRPTTPTVD